MANLLKGKDVSLAIIEDCKKRAESLKANGINPTLAIIRVGENDGDISYEKGARKRCDEIGIEVKGVVFPEDVDKEAFYNALNNLNNDDNVHGILMLRPLPKHLDNELARTSINPSKDIDGCSDASLAGIFTAKKHGFAPCTAEAAIAILDYYGIDVEGKNVTIIGRSLVIGKPVSMLLLNRNATVTICHSKTKNLSDITKNADILICATGQMESISKDFVSDNQTIIDVGVSWNESKGKLCGDVLFEEVEPIVKDITPVPGGVGAVTSSILCRHVIEAAESQYNK